MSQTSRRSDTAAPFASLYSHGFVGVALCHAARGHRAAALDRGRWPDSIPASARKRYDLVALKAWLAAFLRRFFETSQFKRSALPNGPKVGSGGSLPPRGDWRVPSDAKADAWLDELKAESLRALIGLMPRLGR